MQLVGGWTSAGGGRMRGWAMYSARNDFCYCVVRCKNNNKKLMMMMTIIVRRRKCQQMRRAATLALTKWLFVSSVAFRLHEANLIFP